ncbi:MAG: tryptophan synthase subunit alpha [Candidatus Sericytochromatia bacterium]
MSINKVFEQLATENKKAFIPYITAGDPNLEGTELFIKGLIKAGASIIELGVPFSDPIADGVTNQKAAERALKNNISLNDILDFIGNLREKNITIPFVVFTYYNPLLRMGLENFAKKASEKGVNGVLVVDLPPESAEEYKSILDKYNLETIFLASPTTAKERLELIDKSSSGFVYYVSRTGVTGAQQNISSTLKDEIKEVKEIIKKPIAVGFGISTPEQAKEVSNYGEGVIVGSAIVKMIEVGTDINEIANNIYNFSKSIVDNIS